MMNHLSSPVNESSVGYYDMSHQPIEFGDNRHQINHNHHQQQQLFNSNLVTVHYQQQDNINQLDYQLGLYDNNINQTTYVPRYQEHPILRHVNNIHDNNNRNQFSPQHMYNDYQHQQTHQQINHHQNNLQEHQLHMNTMHLQPQNDNTSNQMYQIPDNVTTSTSFNDAQQNFLNPIGDHLSLYNNNNVAPQTHQQVIQRPITSTVTTIQSYNVPATIETSFVNSNQHQNEVNRYHHQHHPPLIDHQQQNQHHYAECSLQQINMHNQIQQTQQIDDCYSQNQQPLVLGSSEEEFSAQHTINHETNSTDPSAVAASVFYPNQTEDMDLLPTIKQQQEQALAFQQQQQQHQQQQQQNSLYLQSTDCIEDVAIPQTIITYNSSHHHQQNQSSLICEPLLGAPQEQLNNSNVIATKLQQQSKILATTNTAPEEISIRLSSNLETINNNKPIVTYANAVAARTANNVLINDNNRLNQCNGAQQLHQSSFHQTRSLSSSVDTQNFLNNQQQNQKSTITNESTLAPIINTISTAAAAATTTTSEITDNNINSNSRRQTDFIDLKSGVNMPQDWLDNICRHLIDHMNRFGICVIDNFLGSVKGDLILKEVKQLYSSGQYIEGRVVNNKIVTSRSLNGDSSVIRNDRVIWVEGCEEGCSEINNLIQTLCSVITNSSRLSLYSNNGLDKIVINKRTKAHVTCYPGNGTRYIKHVDNPNNDGRVITSIYYINKDWNTKRDGGLLRMFPVGMNEVANIEPLFDRVLFFWSDRRNPHEVLPAYKDRFAITVWYIGENRT